MITVVPRKLENIVVKRRAENAGGGGVCKVACYWTWQAGDVNVSAATGEGRENLTLSFQFSF